ncbi:ABC transporter permease [Clostridium sp. Marseille-P299]|uniref:ABC transporter permease n=1 Tax=Clostridium sp. Marseille-P299 TaxID=1805477 RepID=UPI000834A61B|nr:iron chelate uptake ABC transporter family permease subunit [Clostridium sp. Marseille-P299]
MKQSRKNFVILLISLLVLSALSIVIGVKDVSLKMIISGDFETIRLITISRLPRLFSILLTGAGLSIAGLIMQTITGNKFTSPTTAGTMEWCRLGVALAIILAGGEHKMFKIAIAFIISLFGTLLFVQLLSRLKFQNAIMVPLIGMMLGNVVSSITTYIAYKYDIIQNMSSWLQGNFSLVIKGRYEILYLGLPFIIIAYIYANRFTIAGMGESFSTNLGLNHKRVVFIGLVIVAFLSSIIVVTIGSIAFVGLIIPNLVAMYKGDNIRGSLLETAMFGAVFVLICDLIGRTILYPYEVPISVVVSIIGSVIFLLVLFKKRKG